MLQNYQEIYQGEIFRKSHCIELENSLMDFFQKSLTMLNYLPIDLSKKIWRRNNKTVIICLADDVITCLDNQFISNLIDSNTIIITDNRIYSPTNYQVLQLPDSFFGIYYYQPENNKFNPINNINLSVNRLDPVRQKILLELVSYNPVNDIFKNLSVNFNCFVHEKQFNKIDLINNFKSIAQMNDFSMYQSHYEELLNHVPVRTHHFAVEDAAVESFVNMVIETYSGNNTVAISEKIFRALVTPAPWTVFSGRHTVAFLSSIGFDVLGDILDHSYDSNEKNGMAESKYVAYTINAVGRLKNIERLRLVNRCREAAEHNQNLLKTMRQQWPVDFAHWWAANIAKLL